MKYLHNLIFIIIDFFKFSNFILIFGSLAGSLSVAIIHIEI
jgi:hypothetical protein